MHIIWWNQIFLCKSFGLTSIGDVLGSSWSTVRMELMLLSLLSDRCLCLTCKYQFWIKRYMCNELIYNGFFILDASYGTLLIFNFWSTDFGQSGSACYIRYTFAPMLCVIIVFFFSIATLLVATTTFAPITVRSHSSNVIVLVSSSNRTWTIVHCLFYILDQFLSAICWHSDSRYVWDRWHLILVSHGRFKCFYEVHNLFKGF